MYFIHFLTAIALFQTAFSKTIFTDSSIITNTLFSGTGNVNYAAEITPTADQSTFSFPTNELIMDSSYAASTATDAASDYDEGAYAGDMYNTAPSNATTSSISTLAMSSFASNATNTGILTSAPTSSAHSNSSLADTATVAPSTNTSSTFSQSHSKSNTTSVSSKNGGVTNNGGVMNVFAFVTALMLALL
ncbi:hypothetical protein AWRI3579_g965 [Hanseniaspora osmophila]|uniref:Uncharacterized protein n=1 Tax=Hanseniaspora osmophila TaxID=56408 RepID=A0A1E5RNP9_9ASCO|nr:hypothetical protein AWRI3579_g965 [Hanseniaspora osmophila]